MVDKNKLITQLSLKNGLLLSLVWIVIFALLYFINPVIIFTSFWISLVVWILMIALLVFVGMNTRKEIGGFWTFGQAFKSFLIISLILSFTSVFYNLVLVKVINPNYPVEAGVAIRESQKSMMEKLGVPEDKIDEAIEKAGNPADQLRPTIKNTTTGFGVSIAVYGIISLILAAIMKKTEPIRFDSLEDREPTVE